MATPRLDSIISEEVECAICLERLEKPRILSCLHSFCEKCLKEHVAQLKLGHAKPNGVQCPMCKAETSLSSAGISGLRFDFRAARLIEALNESEKREEKITESSQKCEACGLMNCKESNESQYSFCCDCSQILCARCTVTHAGIRVLQNHTLLKISDLISGKVTIQTKEQSTMCPKHTDEKLKLFCVTCSEVICHDCTLFDHSLDKGHKFKFLNDYILTIQEELTSRLVRVNKKTEEFSLFLDLLDKTESHIEKHCGNLAKNNETAVKEHMKRIKDMGDTVSFEQKKILEAKSNDVKYLRQEAQRMKALSEKSSSMTKKVLESTKDYVGIASMYKSLKEAMDKAVSKRPDQEKLLKITTYVNNVHYHTQSSEFKIGRIITGCNCKQNCEYYIACVDGPKDIKFTNDGRVDVLVEEACVSLTGGKETVYAPEGAERVFDRQYDRHYDSYSYLTRNVTKYSSRTVPRIDMYPCIKETAMSCQKCTSFTWCRWLPTVKYDSIVAFAPLSDHRFVLLTSGAWNLLLLGDAMTNLSQGLPSRGSVCAVATDAVDTIYCADKDNRCIYILHDDGQLCRTLTTNDMSPTAIAVSKSKPEHIVVAHNDPPVLSVLDHQGKVNATIRNGNWKKVAVACDAKPLIYVLWTDANHKVTLDRYTMKGDEVDCLLDQKRLNCKDLKLAVSSVGTVAIVTATGKDGKVLLIQS